MSVRLSVGERKKLREWLALSNESVGIVTRRKDGTLRFAVSGRIGGAPNTFHTHNLTHKRGGFDPPSRQDMAILLRYARKGHYVVTHRGIYYVKVKCTVGKADVKRLIRTMSDMQRRLEPGPRYNARYLAEVNSLAPTCLKVTFTPWARTSI